MVSSFRVWVKGGQLRLEVVGIGGVSPGAVLERACRAHGHRATYVAVMHGTLRVSFRCRVCGLCSLCVMCRKSGTPFHGSEGAIL